MLKMRNETIPCRIISLGKGTRDDDDDVADEEATAGSIAKDPSPAILSLRCC